MASGPDAGAEGIVESEFASVRISIDRSGNDARVKIEDLRSDRVAYLDALALETIAWLPPEALEEWHDPSRHRWTKPGPASEAGH